MYDLLERAAREFPNETGFSCDGQDITYGESWRRVETLGRELQNLGVVKGDKIALIAEEPMEFINMFMAVSYCGAVIIPIYLKTGFEKINQTLSFFAIKYVLTNVTKEELQIDEKYISHNIKSESTYKIYINDEYELDDTLMQTALILFSSGTTNMPKAVMLSKRNIYSNIDAINDYLNLDKNDRILIVKNMNHASSIVGEFLVGVAARVRIFFTRKLIRTNTIMRLIETNQITIFFAIPYILENILQYRQLDKYDFSSLKHVNFYGGKLQHEKIMKLCEIMPSVNFIYSYGLTEASPRVTYIMKSELVRKDGSCGRPIKGVDVKIRDEKDQETERGIVGEITVEGSNVMLGYYKNEAQTKATIKNGILYTKDLGYMDSDGYLYVVGRKDNMFIIAGKNVHPEEVEAVLCSVDGVKEALVVKTEPESIQAYVTIDELSSVSLDDMYIVCMKKLEYYKVPKEIIIIPEFQHTVSGKVIRNQDIVKGNVR